MRRDTCKEITSPNSHMASTDDATPRTADEIMCVIGDVTLIESKLARLIKKPSTPCGVVNESSTTVD